MYVRLDHEKPTSGNFEATTRAKPSGFSAVAIGSGSCNCANEQLNAWLADHALAGQRAGLPRTYLGHRGHGLGSRLLAEALRRAVAASDTVAARLVVVDAIDDRAAAFYRDRGFIDIEENPRRLFRKIAVIRRSLEAS